MRFDFIDIPLSPGLLQDLKTKAARDRVPLDDVLCQFVDEILPTIENRLNQPA
jgi:hypothetical protein